LTSAASQSIAQGRVKTAALSDVRCDQPALKKVIIDALNSSSEFQERKIKIINYRSDRTLSADVSQNTISCHAVMVIASGREFPGILKIAAPGSKTDIDWYDDHPGNGLTDIGRPSMPADEAKFIEVVTKAQSAYKTAKTDFAKGAIRPKRAKAICAAMNSTQANNWVGKLIRLTTNGDGKGVLAVEIAPGITVQTFNTALADIGSDTLVEPESRLYLALGELSQGDQVKFSGSFFANPTDCLQESSLTMSGSLTSPEFVMRFVNVQKDLHD
jgi:hypothetical protein